MKTVNKGERQKSAIAPPSTLADYAHTVIEEQYRAVVKLEKKVLADTDPEHLHHMRVSTRRLRTALQVFDPAIALPKAAQAKRIGALARVLGQLRDLDVQIADLQEHYRPLLQKAEQPLLDEAIVTLKRERRKAFASTENALTHPRYKDLKAAYAAWLSEPRYTILGQLPLLPLLPDLLGPLLSELLLHPGWLIQTTSANRSGEADDTLHDLRKACKHVRYQAEFFMPFYGESFQEWVEEIKTIQAALGRVHDSQVLLALLETHLSNRVDQSNLHASIQQNQTEAMSILETVRHKYLDADFRYHLHRMLLEPVPLGN